MTTIKPDDPSAHINTIALSLDEDVHGANGDLNHEQIKDHLIANIHAETNYQYAKIGFPAWAVANLVWSVWAYIDRKYMEEIARWANATPATHKSPTSKPTTATTFAFADNKAVKFAAGLLCPHCSAQLHATAVSVHRGDVRLICQACHRDVLTIEVLDHGTIVE